MPLSALRGGIATKENESDLNARESERVRPAAAGTAVAAAAAVAPGFVRRPGLGGIYSMTLFVTQQP